MAEDFTTKEILIQLMTKVEALSVNQQQLNILVERYVLAGGERDHKMSELKEEVDVIRKDVEGLKTLATKALVVWSIIITAAGFLINKYF